MAESEESKLKRLKHEEHMSRVFDEVMGLGEFADSSRGSAGSCKSSSQDEAKGVDETSGHEEQPPVEDDSCSGRQEEKMNTGVGESRPPPISSSSPQHSSSFNISTSEGGGGGSGAAAFDDALDGLPSLGREEETEEWNFSLPIGALEDVDVTKESSKRKEAEKEDCETQAHDTREEEEDEREISGSTLTSDSFDHTPENSQDGGGVPSQAEETEDSQQEAAEAAPVEDNNHPVSPSVNIKDEPEDEGYDAALLPQSSARQIKEELEQEEELRISSVFSVGGGNTFTPPTRKARKRNFTESEVEVLVGEVEARGTILFGGHSSGITNKRKAREWQHVVAAVNSVSATKRNVAEVRKKWSDLKVEAKRRVSYHRRNRPATVGVQGIPEPTELEKKISSILETTSLCDTVSAREKATDLDKTTGKTVNLQLEAVGDEEVPVTACPGTSAEVLLTPSTSTSRAHAAPGRGRVLTEAVLHAQRDTITAINEVKDELKKIEAVMSTMCDAMTVIVSSIKAFVEK